MTRTFEAVDGKREHVPLLVGLMGASGSGKTFSALRLATGIQRVTGGDIYVVDTESRRALHYADSFTFKHMEFGPPFASLDYLAALQHCVQAGARVVVVDSFSHEHAGVGGYLDFQASEVQRMSGGDAAKAERVKMAGWIKPAAARRRMIDGILQMNANFIFCFRAKEKTKPKKGGGIEELGFMPISGDEILFEETVNILLPPKSGGVPQWRSDFVGEKFMMKLPKQFEALFGDPRPLDEAHGQALAEWARGGKCEGAASATPTDRHVAESGSNPGPRSTMGDAPAKPLTPEEWLDKAVGEVMACKSMRALNQWADERAKGLLRFKQAHPDLAKRLQQIIDEQADSLNVLAAG